MIAQDLRREVHRLLIEGKTDEQILDFMQYRYGDFIHYKPRFELKTSLLWLSPIFLIFIAAIFIIIEPQKKEHQRFIQKETPKEKFPYLSQSQKKTRRYSTPASQG